MYLIISNTVHILVDCSQSGYNDPLGGIMGILYMYASPMVSHWTVLSLWHMYNRYPFDLKQASGLGVIATIAVSFAWFGR